jgi:hypothetical protein
MAIFTPRGLKIRLRTDVAFTYLARLHPKVKAFEVLQTVEALELLPSLFAFGAGIFLLVNNYPPYAVALWVFISSYSGGLISLSGRTPAVFIWLSKRLSLIDGYGLFTILLIAVGLFFSEWENTVFYFIGRYSASFILFLQQMFIGRSLKKKFGNAVTISEMNFFNAYKFHANRVGAKTGLDLRPYELENGKWFEAYSLLESEWPTITARFTDNEIVEEQRLISARERDIMSAAQKGQEFLDGFKKLPYNTDRIGQSFISKVNRASDKE